MSTMTLKTSPSAKIKVPNAHIVICRISNGNATYHPIQFMLGLGWVFAVVHDVT